MDMTQFSTKPSTDMVAADYKGKKFKAVIESVTARHYDARQDQPAADKAVLKFVGEPKTMVLNKTNTKVLIAAYGADSEDWIGVQLGLSTHETDKGTGWVVTPLNLPPPDFDDAIPF